jgi:hypothetical protein
LEEPFLLHPEIDEPKTFLSVEIANKNEGTALKGLDGKNERGKQTIKICNLNREYLKLARKKNVIDEFVFLINSYFELWSNGLITTQDLPKALIIAFKELTEKVRILD